MKHTQSNHDRWQGTKMASENGCVSWCRFQCFSSVPPVFCWFQTNHFYFKKVILLHFIQSEHKHIICKLGIALKINAYVELAIHTWIIVESIWEMPERMHDWNQRCLSLATFGPPSLAYPSSHVYVFLHNHSWGNDGTIQYILNIQITVGGMTTTEGVPRILALYTTDQQHVLIGSTYLPRNNDRRQGRRCTIVDDVPS